MFYPFLSLFLLFDISFLSSGIAQDNRGVKKYVNPRIAARRFRQLYLYKSLLNKTT